MEGTTERERTEFGSFLREVGHELVEARNSSVPSIPTPRADWRKLATPVKAVPGESLRGLVSRACAANHLPNSYGILQYLGQQHRNRVRVSEDPNIDPAELAYAIGVPEDDIRSRRYLSLEPSSVSFFGLKLRIPALETRVRRFAPTALLDRDKNFHRATWELRDLPFCLEHWDMLQDRCGCEGNGIVQGWTRTLTRIGECDSCGDPLALLEPFAVPQEMRPALEILAGLVDPIPSRRKNVEHRIPEQLRTADRSAVFDLVVRLADALDPEAKAKTFEEPSERLYALHEACVALMAWPRGVDDLRWHHTTKESTIRSIKCDWFGLLPLTEASQAAAGGSPSKVCAIQPIGIRPATQTARLSPEVLQSAWEHGILTQHHRVHGARSLPAFDPTELVALGESWRERIEPKGFAYDLGISYHGVEQLAALGTIIADGVALPGTGPHFEPRTVAEFLAKLAQPTMPLQRDTLPLVEAVTLIGGRPKPWGPILHALTSGGIKFAVREGSRRIDRIMICQADVGKICKMSFDRSQHHQTRFSDRMNQRDALEMLNVCPSGDRLLAGLPAKGRCPKTYSVEDVERRARQIVSIPEIAAHLGENPINTFNWLCDQGFREVFPGAWDRTVLNALCSAPKV